MSNRILQPTLTWGWFPNTFIQAVHINKQLIPVTPGRHHSVTLTEASAVMFWHQLLSSAMCSNDDNDWPVHSLKLSLHDLLGHSLRRLPSTVSSSVIFDSVSCRRTWPIRDNLRRSTFDNMNSSRPARSLTCSHTYSRVLCSQCNMPIL